MFACETRITKHIDHIEGVEQILLIFSFLIIPFNDKWQREAERKIPVVLEDAVTQ